MFAIAGKEGTANELSLAQANNRRIFGLHNPGNGWTPGVGHEGSFTSHASAKFGWAKVPKAPVGPSFEYCGMVNVKNNRGSYDGMQPFLATITTWDGKITGGAIAAIDTGNREENREVIPKLCRQKGLNPFEAKELGRR